MAKRTRRRAVCTVSHPFSRRSRFALNASVEKAMVTGSRSSMLEILKVALGIEPEPAAQGGQRLLPNSTSAGAIPFALVPSI